MNQTMRAGAIKESQWPTAIVVSGTILLATIVYSLKADAELDRSFTLLINTVANHSRVLDHFFLAMTHGNFISGSVLVGLIWYAWFQFPALNERAELLVGTSAAVLFGMGSRVLQLVLPSHLRPLHDPMLVFQVPAGVNPSTLSGWSSFPSDHAAVYFGLAYITYRINTRIGMIAIASAILFDFARVYLGYHYLSDIVGGAALGILGVAISLRPTTIAMAKRLLSHETTQPGLFYMAAFIFSFGLSTLFSDLRIIAEGVIHDLGLF